MKVLFVLVDFNYLAEYNPWYSGSFHLGIGYLSSSLKKAGFSVDLVHLLKPVEEGEFVKQLGEIDPDLVAFTSFTHQFPEVTKLASWVKRSIGVQTICGGVHVTLDPEGAISNPYIDMICIGEGEKPLVELCTGIASGKNYAGTESIWLKSSGQIKRNRVRPLVENLDSFPIPDWEIFDYSNLNEGKSGRLSILTSRGCPYNCTYCSNHGIKQAYPNKNRYVRARDVDQVLAEIKRRLDGYPNMNHMCVLDDTLGLNLDWLEEFAEKYRSNFNLPIATNSRVEIINNNRAFDLFRKINLKNVALGIESGNDYIRMNIMNRKMTGDEICDAIERCKRNNIRVMSYNMVGLPFEDMSMILDTIKLNAKTKPNDMHVSVFQPYPFTALYKICIKKGFLKEDQEINTFFEESVLDLPDLSKREIMFALKNFNLFVKLYSLGYFLPSFLFRPLEKVLDEMFTKCRYHNLVNMLNPLLNWPLFPVRRLAKLMKNISPGLVRYIKTTIRGI